MHIRLGYVNTCMDSIDAVATNYSSLFTACSNISLCGCMLNNIGLINIT